MTCSFTVTLFCFLIILFIKCMYENGLTITNCWFINMNWTFFCFLSFQINEILSIHLWIESLLKSNFWRILDESWCNSFHENFKDMTYIFSLYVVFQICAISQGSHSVWICLCAFVKDKWLLLYPKSFSICDQLNFQQSHKINTSPNIIVNVGMVMKT